MPIATTPDQLARTDPDVPKHLSIAGGTTQILLNQVAERVLGLPR